MRVPEVFSTRTLFSKSGPNGRNYQLKPQVRIGLLNTALRTLVFDSFWSLRIQWSEDSTKRKRLQGSVCHNHAGRSHLTTTISIHFPSQVCLCVTCLLGNLREITIFEMEVQWMSSTDTTNLILIFCVTIAGQRSNNKLAWKRTGTQSRRIDGKPMEKLISTMAKQNATADCSATGIFAPSLTWALLSRGGPVLGRRNQLMKASCLWQLSLFWNKLHGYVWATTGSLRFTRSVWSALTWHQNVHGRLSRVKLKLKYRQKAEQGCKGWNESVTLHVITIIMIVIMILYHVYLNTYIYIYVYMYHFLFCILQACR